MNFIQRLLLKWSGCKVAVPLKPEHKITDKGIRTVEAFVIDGVKYYQFENPFETNTLRYFAVIAAYEELKMRCDREYLELFTKAIENILSPAPGKKMNLQHLAQLNIYLRERLELMPTSDFIYRLCSVLFFDETESADFHDYQYAEKKIARWKSQPGTLDFFLSKPIKELMPSLNLPTENTQMYLGVVEKIHAKQLAFITNSLSEN